MRINHILRHLYVILCEDNIWLDLHVLGCILNNNLERKNTSISGVRLVSSESLTHFEKRHIKLIQIMIEFILWYQLKPIGYESATNRNWNNQILFFIKFPHSLKNLWRVQCPLYCHKYTTLFIEVFFFTTTEGKSLNTVILSLGSLYLT